LLRGIYSELLTPSLDNVNVYIEKERGANSRVMAKVTVNFLGPLRLFLGAPSTTVEAARVTEVRESIEREYGPVFKKKIQSMGVKKNTSLWDNSLFLLNGRSLKKEDDTVLKDGDRLDLGLAVAGG
jgi:molybdopterin converting factor small subunit